MFSICRTKQKLLASDSDLKTKRKEIREAEVKIQELNAIVAKTETALMNKEEEVVAFEKDVDQLRANLQSLESDKKSLKKQVSFVYYCSGYGSCFI